jgi:hypothetical protein
MRLQFGDIGVIRRRIVVAVGRFRIVNSRSGLAATFLIRCVKSYRKRSLIPAYLAMRNHGIARAFS